MEQFAADSPVVAGRLFLCSMRIRRQTFRTIAEA